MMLTIDKLKYREIAFTLFVFALLFFSFVSNVQANTYVSLDPIGSSGPGNGQFDYPQGIAISPISGNLFVTDGSSGGSVCRVEQFTQAGTFVSSFGSCGYGTPGLLNHPTGIDISASGDIYVADRQNNWVHYFNSSGVAQDALSHVSNSPIDVAISPTTGKIYVPIFDASRIDVFDSLNQYLFTFPSGVPGTTIGTQNSIGPSLAISPSTDNLFFTNIRRHTIQVFDAAGTYLSEIGNGYGYGDGQMKYPRGINLSPNTGNIYVVDDWNDRVQIFNQSGDYLDQFSIAPHKSWYNWDYRGIAIAPSEDDTETIYVTDTGNDRIQVFRSIPITFSTTTLNTTIEGNSTTYTVVLDQAPTDDVTITLSASTPDTGSGVTFSDSTLTFTTENWSTPQTVIVTATNDSSNDGYRSVDITNEISSTDDNFTTGTSTISLTITEDDYTNISTCIELQAMNENLADFYSLTQDIDCSDTINWNSGAGFEPVGDSGDPFTGHLEGNGHTISNLYIHRPSTDDVGIFGYVDTGNFPFELSNLTITGTIEGQSYVGGIAGEMYGSGITLDNINIEADIIAEGVDANIAGIVGILETNGNEQAVISDSSMIGDIDVNSPTSIYYGIGAFVGTSVSPLNVSNSYSTGVINVNAGTYIEWGVGGIVGGNGSTLNITDCYSTSDINIQVGTYISYGVAGLIGSYWGEDITIANSYYSGDISITAGTYVDYGVGGLVGYADGETDISNSFSTGNIEVEAGTYASHVGGLLGIWDYDSLDITNSYSTSNITVNAGDAITSIGGLIGALQDDDSTVSNSFSTGQVSLTSDTEDYVTNGGFIGEYIDGENEFSHNYYFSNQSLCTGQDDPDPSWCNVVTDTEYFKNTDENDPLSAWDFHDIWSKVGDNYPILTSLPSPYPEALRRSSSGGGHVKPKPVTPETPPTITLPEVTPFDCLPNYLFSPSTGKPCSPLQTTVVPVQPVCNGAGITITLKQGMTNEQVKCLQQYLNSHNYPVSLSGPGSKDNETTLFGPKTKAAVIFFQKAHSLVPDGIVGPVTRGELE